MMNHYCLVSGSGYMLGAADITTTSNGYFHIAASFSDGKQQWLDQLSLGRPLLLHWFISY